MSKASAKTLVKLTLQQSDGTTVTKTASGSATAEAKTEELARDIASAKSLTAAKNAVDSLVLYKNRINKINKFYGYLHIAGDGLVAATQAAWLNGQDSVTYQTQTMRNRHNYNINNYNINTSHCIIL